MPNPNPPSLGWPFSFTPHPFTHPIQLLTTASSFSSTKSKKLRPIAADEDRSRSFDAYRIAQCVEKRSRMNAVRKDLDGSGSKEMTACCGAGAGSRVDDGLRERRPDDAEMEDEDDAECERRRWRRGGGGCGGLWGLPRVAGGLRLAAPHDEDAVEGDGDGGVRACPGPGMVMDVMPAGIGEGGIGEGSCQRCGSYKLEAERKARTSKEITGLLTLNSKFAALGEITVISCAVDALCSALAPGLAKETLPTRTLCTTVLDTQGQE